MTPCQGSGWTHLSDLLGDSEQQALERSTRPVRAMLHPHGRQGGLTHARSECVKPRDRDITGYRETGLVQGNRQPSDILSLAAKGVRGRPSRATNVRSVAWTVRLKSPRRILRTGLGNPARRESQGPRERSGRVGMPSVPVSSAIAPMPRDPRDAESSFSARPAVIIDRTKTHTVRSS